MINIIISAFISFLTTNLDDIVVVMLMFSAIKNNGKNRDVVIGQYLGIGVIVLISVICAFGLSNVPRTYIKLLGIVPILLGIKEYIEYLKEKKKDDSPEKDLLVNNSLRNSKFVQGLSGFINPNIIKVTLISIANGGDNLGIYIPIFATLSPWQLIVTLIVFFILTGVLCFVGYKLWKYPLIQGFIEKYSHIIIPVVFVAIGVFIIVA